MGARNSQSLGRKTTASIKRFPAMTSDHQEDVEVDKENRAGCGRNCLSKCCLLQGAKLPFYAFSKTNKAFSAPSGRRDLSFLNELLLRQWEDRMNRGIFRHNLTACETKVIPGEHGFVAQLNEARYLTRRPTEFRVDQVLQAFDEKKFNFTKVGQEEALFRFEVGESDASQYFPDAPVHSSSSPNIVAINVSPIEYGHVLLIPRILDCLPQRIDRESFLLALCMAAEAASPYFRLGYNSLGAFATVNHLHFQAYYLAIPFPVQKASTQRIATLKSGVDILQLSGYPVRSLVFESRSRLQDLADAVSSACIFLQENGSPFNILISDCGKRVFLFPQCYAEKRALGLVSQEILDLQMTPATWEISGHLVFKIRKEYEEASEGKACNLLAALSLSEERFDSVKEHLMRLLLGSADDGKGTMGSIA